jgi:hypothetical protein
MTVAGARSAKNQPKKFFLARYVSCFVYQLGNDDMFHLTPDDPES